MAARDPARFDLKNIFFSEQYKFDIGCTAKVSFHDATAFEARSISTFTAPDGCVTASPSTYASERTLRVRDSIALYEDFPGLSRKSAGRSVSRKNAGLHYAPRNPVACS